MSDHEDFRKIIASRVLIRSEDGAIILSPEAQGGKREKWIFDFRAVLMQPEWMNQYAEIFWEKFASQYPFQVGGMETGAIPLVAAIVMKSVERGTPINGFFLRKSRKREGLTKVAEGTLTNDPIILVDDLINSGQTFAKQLITLADMDKRVSDIFVLVAFREKESYTFAQEKNVVIKSLFTLKDFGIPLLSAKAPEVPQDSFEVVWRYQAPSPSYHLVVQKSAPVLDDERVYVGCDDGKFRALDQKTGEVAWEFAIGSHPTGKAILSTPRIMNGVVYFGAYDGTVYALEATTGKKIWAYDDADWIGSSPDVASDLGLVFIGLEFGLFRKHGGIVALDLKTGKYIWSARHSGLTHGSPLYIKEEKLVVIGSNDGILYAYDAKTGVLRWNFATRGDIKTRAAYDAKRRVLLFGSMDGTFYGLSAIDGSPTFARECGAGIYSIPLIANDTVYVSSLDKNLYAIDLSSGKDRWVFETSGRIFASPTLADSSIWIGSNDGKLYELDPFTGKLKNFFQASERIVNAIAFNKDFLFVPTVANEIYCLKRKK